MSQPISPINSCEFFFVLLFSFFVVVSSLISHSRLFLPSGLCCPIRLDGYFHWCGKQCFFVSWNTQNSLNQMWNIFHVYYHLLGNIISLLHWWKRNRWRVGKRIKFISGGDCYKDLFKSLVPRQSDFSSIHFGHVSTKYILTQIDSTYIFNMEHETWNSSCVTLLCETIQYDIFIWILLRLQYYAFVWTIDFITELFWERESGY